MQLKSRQFDINSSSFDLITPLSCSAICMIASASEEMRAGVLVMLPPLDSWVDARASAIASPLR